MGYGIGYGKIILFNEHFVVYGIPAIASAIGMKTSVNINRINKGIIISDNRNKNPKFERTEDKRLVEVVNHILGLMGIKITGFEFILKGDLLTSSGLGSSAAFCVALVRAISDEFNLKISMNEINRLAYEGEKLFHGNPSGIDNTASTFGGLIFFQKGKMNSFEAINMKKSFKIVLGDSGLLSGTKEAVDGVKNRKESNPKKYKEIFTESKELVENAKQALLEMDALRIGVLMDQNHILLQKIEVSTSELDLLVNLAKENGALGAKMTGGGLGGYMVALAPDEIIQLKIAEAIMAKGFNAYMTSIG